MIMCDIIEESEVVTIYVSICTLFVSFSPFYKRLEEKWKKEEKRKETKDYGTVDKPS